VLLEERSKAMKWNTDRKLHSSVLALYYYARLRHPKRWGWLPWEEKGLIDSLFNLGIPVQDFVVSVGQYKDYFDRAEYSSRYPEYYRWNIAEKSLEHFVAQQLLELNPTDVYIDIDSEGSPVPEIYQRLYGCVTYAQDLSYQPGIHDNRIGSDAASLPLPDGAATKMALHCSFEHFEGDSDSGFIKEAARVLPVGGKIVIVPLYLAPRYAIVTDPLVSRASRVRFEPDVLVMAVKGWGNRHGRFYDPHHLASRVLGVANDLMFSILRIVNTNEVDETAYARFVLVGTKIKFQPNKPTAGDGK